MLLEVIHSQRDKILELAAQHGASNLRVFGSVARGEETADSDIDIVADFAPGRSYADLVRLKRLLENLFHRPIDLTSRPSVERIYDVIEDDLRDI